MQHDFLVFRCGIVGCEHRFVNLLREFLKHAVLQIEWVVVLTIDNDGFLLAPNKIENAVVVEESQVASTQPTVGQHLIRSLLVIVITQHQARTLDLNLAQIHDPLNLSIANDANLHVGHRPTRTHKLAIVAAAIRKSDFAFIERFPVKFDGAMPFARQARCNGKSIFSHSVTRLIGFSVKSKLEERSQIVIEPCRNHLCPD